MKLLPPKKEIDKEKAQERKREIDDGMRLAQRVDALRRAKDEEEKGLKEYRLNALKAVQYDIDQRIEELNNLDKQIKECYVTREELLKPLDREWAEINLVKAELAEEKSFIYLSVESLKIEEGKINSEKEKVSKIIAKAKENEKETEKAKRETISLKEMAQREYDMARSEHIVQTDIREEALSDAKKLQESYQNGLTIIEKESQLLKEKEEEIIIREKDLQKQQVVLQIAAEEIKKHATINQSS